MKTFYLTQCIKTCACEKLNINNLYFDSSLEKAKDIMYKETEEIIHEKFEDCTEEQILDSNMIEETKKYWEYCDTDGNNIVVMIHEIEIPIPAFN